jgi:hypothetical protein
MANAKRADDAYFVQVRAGGSDAWVTQAIATSWDSAARAVDNGWARILLGAGRPVQYRVITEVGLVNEGGSDALAGAIASLEHEVLRAVSWLEASVLA